MIKTNGSSDASTELPTAKSLITLLQSDLTHANTQQRRDDGRRGGGRFGVEVVAEAVEVAVPMGY